MSRLNDDLRTMFLIRVSALDPALAYKMRTLLYVLPSGNLSSGAPSKTTLTLTFRSATRMERSEISFLRAAALSLCHPS